MNSVSVAIEQAVAPVFLLTGIGAILSVLVGRLARIIDRNRVLHGRLQSLGGFNAEDVQAEIALMAQRARIVHFSIAANSLAALLISCVVAVLFISSLVDWHTGALVATLFILAMFFVIVALLGFLREVHLATSVMLRGA